MSGTRGSTKAANSAAMVVVVGGRLMRYELSWMEMLVGLALVYGTKYSLEP